VRTDLRDGSRDVRIERRFEGVEGVLLLQDLGLEGGLEEELEVGGSKKKVPKEGRPSMEWEFRVCQ